MKSDELRKSILGRAIRGKLIVYNNSDETIFDLLKKIDKTKITFQEFCRSKTIKTSFSFYDEDSNKYIEHNGNKKTDISDEIPFDIPAHWVWSRLESIANIYTGNSINELEKKNKYSNNENGYCYIGTKDVKFDHSIDYQNGIKIPFENDSFKISPANSILLCIEGGSAGKKIAFTNQSVCFGNKLASFSTYGFSPLFLYYYLQSQDFIEIFTNSKSGIIGGVGINKLKNLLVPLPPLGEQLKIVQRIEELDILLKIFDTLEVENSTVEISLINELSKSLLKFAFQGKLVGHISSEGTTEEFLSKFDFAKVKLSLNRTNIYKDDNEIYFEKDKNRIIDISELVDLEISEDWKFSRLGSIIKLVSGRDLEANKYSDTENGIPYVTGASNFLDGNLSITRWTKSPAVVSKLGDLLITCKGTIGDMAYNTIGDMHIARQVMAISSPVVKIEYIRLFMIYYINKLKKSAKSMIPGISRKDILDIIIPVPPLLEQQRIISRLHECFTTIESINKNT